MQKIISQFSTARLTPEQIVLALGGVIYGAGWTAHCPAHEESEGKGAKR